MTINMLKNGLIQVRVINVGHCPLGSYKGVVSFVVTLAGFEKDMFSFLFFPHHAIAVSELTEQNICIP